MQGKRVSGNEPGVSIWKESKPAFKAFGKVRRAGKATFKSYLGD